jgi:mono/diheme cytochrome c family protein
MVGVLTVRSLVHLCRGISDRDLAAMVVYLRSVSPVHHATERSTYPSPIESQGQPIASVPDPQNDPVARGAYLAVNLAHCMNCHSARLADGRKDPTRPGASGATFVGPWGTAIARNISSDPEAGVGKWTDAQILSAITRGISPDGRPLVRPMGGRASVWMRLTDTDKQDLLAYIRSLLPQEP